MKKNILQVQNLLLPNYTGSVFAYGNSKLPKNTLIVNLSSAQNCPSKSHGLCKVADYYRMIHKLGEFTAIRYDVIAICGEELTWIQNAFSHVY